LLQVMLGNDQLLCSETTIALLGCEWMSYCR